MGRQRTVGVSADGHVNSNTTPGTAVQNYTYEITVSNGTNSITSSDPDIQNEAPPSGG